MPITLTDAKEHLRVEGNAEDGYIGRLIAAADRHVEFRTSVVCTKRADTFRFDCFGSEIVIPRGPVDLATIAVKYIDEAGVEQTLAASGYRVVSSKLATRLLPPVTGSWPRTRAVPAAVTVTAQVGFAPPTDQAPSACSDGIKHAARLLLGHWHATREGVNVGNIVSKVPLAVDELLDAERIFPVSFA